MSLADAEAAEDAVEVVVGIDGADDLAELFERGAHLGGDQLVSRTALCRVRGAIERGRGEAQALAAAIGRGGNDAGLCGGAAQGVFDGTFQFGQPHACAAARPNCAAWQWATTCWSAAITWISRSRTV